LKVSHDERQAQGSGPRCLWLPKTLTEKLKGAL
jgi:hypothetical protein